MNNKTNEIIIYTEDIVKYEIAKFLNLLKYTNERHLFPLQIIDKTQHRNPIQDEFIKIKDKINRLMKQKINNEVTLSTEDIVKYEIFKFLNVIKEYKFASEDDYITLINGGMIDNKHIDGFLKLKENIYNLINKQIDCNSVTMKYIQYNKKLKNFNYETNIYGIKMYDFQNIRKKILEITTEPNLANDSINYIKKNINNYKFDLIKYIETNK